VTTKAIERTTDEVGSTRNARRRDLEFDVPQGTRTRSDDDTPELFVKASAIDRGGRKEGRQKSHNQNRTTHGKRF
jgi:hypothetical protein